jgi:hypothetical protein
MDRYHGIDRGIFGRGRIYILLSGSRASQSAICVGSNRRGLIRARRSLEHFQEKPALAKAGVESGFPSENAENAKMPERFLFPVYAKPL